MDFLTTSCAVEQFFFFSKCFPVVFCLHTGRTAHICLMLLVGRKTEENCKLVNTDIKKKKMQDLKKKMYFYFLRLPALMLKSLQDLLHDRNLCMFSVGSFLLLPLSLSAAFKRAVWTCILSCELYLQRATEILLAPCQRSGGPRGGRWWKGGWDNNIKFGGTNLELTEF